MSITVSSTAVSKASRLIRQGKVNNSSPWSFSAADGNRLLGPDGDNWTEYGSWHLGRRAGEDSDTKARYAYPYGKGGRVYRSALIAIRQRAGQQDQTNIFEAAGRLLNQIDGGNRGMTEQVRTVSIKTGETIHRSFNTEVKVIGDRQIRSVISAEVEDRDGDIVRVAGIDTMQYERNPVVLFAHNHERPIAKAVSIGRSDNHLEAIAEFPKLGINEDSDRIYSLIKEGILSATSIGFVPKDWDYRKQDDGGRGGIEFNEVELVEFSFVSVPSNPDALVLERGWKEGKHIEELLRKNLDEQVREVKARHVSQPIRLRAAQVELLKLRSGVSEP